MSAQDKEIPVKLNLVNLENYSSDVRQVMELAGIYSCRFDLSGFDRVYTFENVVDEYIKDSLANNIDLPVRFTTPHPLKDRDGISTGEDGYHESINTCIYNAGDKQLGIRFHFLPAGDAAEGEKPRLRTVLVIRWPQLVSALRWTRLILV